MTSGRGRDGHTSRKTKDSCTYIAGYAVNVERGFVYLYIYAHERRKITEREKPPDNLGDGEAR